eukprot:1158623-Pelagomonas_calceolata.AAC.5
MCPAWPAPPIQCQQLKQCEVLADSSSIHLILDARAPYHGKPLQGGHKIRAVASFADFVLLFSCASVPPVVSHDAYNDILA